MDFQELLVMGASMIQGDSDEATTGLDVQQIAGALSKVLGGESGSIDLSSLVQSFLGSGLGDTVQSWLGEGENAPIDPQAVESALGSEKVSAFAEELGISRESARRALAEAVPDLVDRATPPGSDTLSTLLDQVGGLEGAMGMIGKMFGKG
ncbi:YidB family protein [Nitratifractor sp.]